MLDVGFSRKSEVCLQRDLNLLQFVIQHLSSRIGPVLSRKRAKRVYKKFLYNHLDEAVLTQFLLQFIIPHLASGIVPVHPWKRAKRVYKSFNHPGRSSTHSMFSAIYHPASGIRHRACTLTETARSACTPNRTAKPPDIASTPL
jgi:hypothetical protein